MRKKRILSSLLSLTLLAASFVTPTFAENTDKITAYVNLSQNGQLVSDKTDNILAMSPVSLSGKESYTIDDALKTFHDTYYEGESGYETYDSESFGLSLSKLWGVDNGLFGYIVNGGKEMPLNLSHPVTDGTVIDAILYQNAYPDTESYTAFNKYSAETYIKDSLELTLKKAGYDEAWNTVFSPCENASITINGKATDYKTNSDGQVSLSFDTAGTYIVSAQQAKQSGVDNKTVTAITAPTCIVKVADLTAVSVPSDAELFVGTKGNVDYVAFSEVKPHNSITENDITTYYFDLTDKKQYNYRVSGKDYITYGGIFTKTADTALNITREQLSPSGKSKTTVDRDTSSNNEHNVGDIYLNINPQGHLKLSSGDTFQIVSFRNWQATNGITSNYFIEPDYHFKAIDENGAESNVVSINENGLLTANKSGTAIVLVTYDAITLNFGSSDDFYGAIWPENTGVFVVDVDSEEISVNSGMTINSAKNSSAIKLSGDTIDAEHDCIYYTGDKGSYTFTPETDVSVFVANPSVDDKVTYNGFTSVDKNSDNSFTVPLLTGRNIIKLQKDGKTSYQLITAKKVSITVNNGEVVHTGDILKIAFDKLYHPANKLSKIYNMYAAVIYSNVSAYDGKLAGSPSVQYDFANNQTAQIVSKVLKEENQWGSINYVEDTALTVPLNYSDSTFTLSGGYLYTSGWGDPYGYHRTISYETGRTPQKNYDAKPGYFGILPDITIPVNTSPIESISAVTADVKTDYIIGDTFDTKNLVLNAVYEDKSEQNNVKNYTVYPPVLTEDTENVIITYKGKTLEIPVTVRAPKVAALEISQAPLKTSYTVGETFNPTGMKVMAVYENNTKKETTDYTYSPKRELAETDNEMIISYTGNNGIDDVKSASLPITVSKAGGSGSGISSDTMYVYFTLLGDDKHGTPSGDSDTHTLKSGNLQAWIPKTKITVEKDFHVIDVIEKALGLYGYPFTNENNYINEIKGLNALDNGSNSGWMYTLNGKYTLLGIDEQTLDKGDSIIFHYTDDYTVEEDDFSSSNNNSSSGSSKKDNTTYLPVIDSSTSVKPTFGANTYSDVKEDSWYYEAVKYAYNNDLMNGTDKGFEPNLEATRAMLVTVLWRYENEPKVDYSLSFNDVSDSSWYASAVRWAAKSNIVSGISDKYFGSDEPITREQMATILYRYLIVKNTDVSDKGDISSYSDSQSVSEYAKTALSWAVGAGIMNGRDNNTLCPKASATRAETAAMLMRFFTKYSF